MIKLIVTFILGGLILIPFASRNKKLYQKHDYDLFYGNMVQQYSYFNDASNNPVFYVTKNFFAYTVNLLIKYVVFSIVITLLYFWHSIILVAVLWLLAILEWRNYSIRRTYYNNLRTREWKDAHKGIFEACICMPLYQSILCVLASLAFVL